MKAMIKEIRNLFPNLISKPIVNDEADPVKSWWKEKSWRGTARYAALVVETIIRTQYEIIEDMKVDLDLLSNDNAFLNQPPAHFDQRTLLTRFLCPRNESLLLQKPVFNAMAMLGLLGDERLETEVTGLNRGHVLASRQHASNGETES